ncbi:hypothetical protein KCU73_g665, partial [Aureobasidium melanogenum]
MFQMYQDSDKPALTFLRRICRITNVMWIDGDSSDLLSFGYDDAPITRKVLSERNGAVGISVCVEEESTGGVVEVYALVTVTLDGSARSAGGTQVDITKERSHSWTTSISAGVDIFEIADSRRVMTGFNDPVAMDTFDLRLAVSAYCICSFRYVLKTSM